MTKTKAKAETIYLELREHIRGLEEGVRLSSVLELRQKFQTSQHSVDKALDRLEREKLIIKKPRLGIRVAPRPEKEVASKRIAFAAWTSGHSKELSGGSHPYYGPIIQTIAEQAALLGYEESVYLFRSHGILDSGTTLERDISKGLISGLIISSWDLTKKDLPFLEAHGVHTVLIGTDHLQCGYPCVTVNNVKLGLLTSQATMSSGRSPVAVISAEDPRIDVETFLMTQESEGNPVQPGYHIHYPPLKGGDQEAIKRGREAAE
ncbi:MAG: GntR family transcriptional regulator, partial [Lentisphaeria bacterium]|nr:GntR family transcriptional regulator [Lentisphaeria bacterium]NQZ71161.1 GntR family transcriptional regulator [Lentisphaeria bacterium]